MKHKQWLFPCVMLAIVMTSVCGVTFYYLDKSFRSWVDDDPTTYPLQQVETLLRAIASQVSTPDINLIEEHDWGILSQECPVLLREYMVKNNNQYTMYVAAVFGDNGTPIPGTGTDAVLINVVFPDESRIQMQFYGNIFETCHKLDPE
jgi:hypothetical protein